MDFIFNELSFDSLNHNIHTGKQRMQDMLQVCKHGREKGMSRLAIRYDFYEQPLSNDYTVHNWLSDQAVSPILKNLFQSIVRHPYINKKDKAIEDRYISSYAYLIEGQRIAVEGLVVAYLYNTIGISFFSSEKWNANEIELHFSEGPITNQTVQTKHASTVSHFKAHEDWLTKRIGVKLTLTEKEIEQKRITLRHDHGRDTLLTFSKKLIRSPFVVEIINSMPFNPHETSFIRRCYEDGKVEIVLTRSDAGFGVIIQTTGRTLLETEEIGKILDRDYQHAY